LDWIKNTVLAQQFIDANEVEYISLTDDPLEVVAIMNKHRAWKQRKIAEAGSAGLDYRPADH
jgi:hypothetical protein